jgi:hypothetical protein
LDIPVGATPASLGSAYSARAADAYAPVWNPAGLGFLNAIQVSGTHVSYLSSVNYEFLGAVLPFQQEQNGLGFSVQYLGSGDIPGYTLDANNSPVAAGNFSATFAAYSLAYGQKVTEDLSVGLTGKVITESISGTSAKGYAGDLGLLYKASDRLSLAGTATNVGPSVRFVDQKDPLPRAFHAGVLGRLYSDLDVSAEGVYRQNGQVSGSAGLAWTYEHLLTLRTGVDSSHSIGLSPISLFTAGAGLTAWGQEFSIAWVPYGDLGNAFYFSLDLRFGAPAEKAPQAHLHTLASAAEDEPVTRPPAGGPDYQNLYQLLSEDEKRSLQKSHPADPGQQP